MKLQGRTALVTGASRGIGRAIALALAQEGADVVVNYNDHPEEAQRVVKLIQDQGRRAAALKANVSRSQEVDPMVRTVLGEFRKIDILVCNAGVGCRSLIVETTDEEWTRVFDINVRGVFNFVRAVMPAMMKQRYGKIITISSVIAKKGAGWVSKSTYAASKAAVIAYTKGIALEGAEYGITANSVCPGWVDKEGMGGARPSDVREQAMKQIPLARGCTPEEIGAAVVFLVSEDASYMTGSTIDLNGGLLME